MNILLRRLPMALGAIATAFTFSVAAPAAAQSFAGAESRAAAQVVDVGFKVKVKKRHHARSHHQRAHRYYRSSRSHHRHRSLRHRGFSNHGFFVSPRKHHRSHVKRKHLTFKFRSH